MSDLADSIDELLAMHHAATGSATCRRTLREAAAKLRAAEKVIEAARAIRPRIPFDAENEDANGWGAVDATLAEWEKRHE